VRERWVLISRGKKITIFYIDKLTFVSVGCSLNGRGEGRRDGLDKGKERKWG
jgi:hypothetical protein